MTFSSAAMGRVVNVAVLTPAGAGSAERGPASLLLLLHGHGGSWRAWVDHGVDRIVGDRNLVVVMPDGGYDGWYSDWIGTDLLDALGTARPPVAPAWETFHLRELLPWVEAHYPVRRDRAGRFVAGLSMGGFGATSYAARHPDLFAAAGSFSGAVNPELLWPLGPVLVSVGANAVDLQPPRTCVWGDPVTGWRTWRAHNPTRLAPRLRGVRLFLATGDGRPGPHDGPSTSATSALFESGIWAMNRTFDRALSAAGVAHTAWFYGPGTHNWPYWQDDLGRFLAFVGN